MVDGDIEPYREEKAMTGTKSKAPDGTPVPAQEPWTAHPMAILVAAVALSLAASLLVSRPGGEVAPATEPAGEDAAGVEPDADPAPAADPATAERIAADPTQVGTPVGARAATTVDVELETVELEGQLADGTVYHYWTFDRQVPGPMIRVRVGDTVKLTLANSAESSNIHSIDLHAVTGPGGGAVALQVPPGGSKSITFKALNPGVYIYHCATPHIPTHIANGMYGLIVVEPEGGLAPVDREFYLVQGEIYTATDRGAPGVVSYDFAEMVDENPDYVTFNGAVNALTGDHAMQAEVGERIRLFIGNGGPNLVSSFHVIGEIFDVVHDQGASEGSTNVQTTLIPAGGAAWVEFTADVPGDYILVDHAITRSIDKGALAILTVTGDSDPSIYEAHDGEAAEDGHTSGGTGTDEGRPHTSPATPSR